jgi:large subunit ribosomal protein L10
MNKQDKVKRVEELRHDFGGLDNLVLMDFRGLDVRAVSEIRRQVREVKGRYEVVQNRLAKRAVEASPLALMRERLSGPTAVAYSQDNPIALLKALTAAAKKYPQFRFKAGMVEGRVVSLEELQTYANLPGRPELIARLASLLQGPLSRLVRALSAPLQSLAGALDQVAKSKA